MTDIELKRYVERRTKGLISQESLNELIAEYAASLELRIASLEVVLVSKRAVPKDTTCKEPEATRRDQETPVSELPEVPKSTTSHQDQGKRRPGRPRKLDTPLP